MSVNSPMPPARQQPLTTAQAPSVGEVVDCWNQIGVAGDASCGELAQFVHCRNCPVYSAAGARLLDRELPADYRRDWTEHFSRKKDQVASGRTSVVVFRIGAEWLALSTRAFQEVTGARRVHSMPHRRRGVLLGLINVRGELRLCVSLGRLLGIEGGDSQKNPTLHERLVVAEWQGAVLTFPVDEIQGIHRYAPEDVKAAPGMAARTGASFTKGLLSWQDRTIGCLDEDLIFSTLNRSLA